MIEIWHSFLNKGNKVAVIVMDLSKAFDTLKQNLFLCKLKAYNFDRIDLTFIQSHFSNRHQRAKAGGKFSMWQKVSKNGVPQSSILRLLFFNIFINDLILFIATTTLYNYVYDSTMYSSDKKLILGSTDSDMILLQYQNGFMKTTWFLTQERTFSKL